MPNQTPVDLEAALKGQSPALAAKDAVYRWRAPGYQTLRSGRRTRS